MSLPIVTRAEFQQLAGERLDEAQTLLTAGKWGGAYYLAGYAVELALKACVIKRLMATDAFPAKDLSRDCYSHDLDGLLRLAGLDGLLPGYPAVRANWVLARDWSEQKRYHRVVEAEARVLVAAIADAADGVLPWLTTHY